LARVSFLPSQAILNELRKRISTFEKVKIAIAFLSKKGLDTIEPVLIKSLKNGKKIKFIVGISDSGITDPEALKHLYKLAEDFKGTFSVGYYNTERFHPKMFLFEKENECAAIVGSSNLTGTGFGENIEANVLVEGADTESIFKDIFQYYRLLWDGKDDLTADISELYAKEKKRSTKVNKHYTDIPRTIIPPIASFRTGISTLGDLLDELNKDYFFMMHLSYRGKEKERLWKFAVQNEVIGLQRKFVNENWAKIREKVLGHIDGTWIYQFDRFCTCGPKKEEGMNFGDIVVILDGQYYLLGIAQVTGDHEYKGELKKKFFDHVRPVAWKYLLNYEDRLPIDQIEGFSKTLKRVERERDASIWQILTSVKYN
jgi:HKD family nuclease